MLQTLVILQAVKNNQMQRKKVKSSGCPMLKKQSLQRQFKEKLEISGAMDVEDLVKLGQQLGTCPYYGSRRAVPAADLVVLPYQSLLHSSTRETLGVKLKDCVIIIDEAHNLVDTVSNIYSCQVSATQVGTTAAHSLSRQFHCSYTGCILNTNLMTVSKGLNLLK